MSIRLPLQNVGTFNDNSEVGAGSVAGGVPHLVTLPQDCDNVVVRFTASLVGTGASATFQTTPDGGTTYYDVARTSIVSNTQPGFEEFMSIPVIGMGFRSQVLAQTSVAGSTNVAIALNAIGKTPASTLGSAQFSGLPLMSQQARVFIILNGNVTSAASNVIKTEVFANSQSARQ